jgi:phosphotransferase system enzyme I (PtsI)
MLFQERVFKGIPVSAGIAFGRVQVVNRLGSVNIEARDIEPGEIENEIKRFETAVKVSKSQLSRIRQQVSDAIDAKHADIFGAQAMVLDDPELIQTTIAAIRKERKNAEFLFNRRVSRFVDILSQYQDEHFQARNNDFLDVANRVLSNLAQRTAIAPPTIAPETVLVAHDLAPSDITPLVKQHVVGFVLEKGGPTSHTAIMAKALEIPAVVGVPLITASADNESFIIIDGINGTVVLNPTEETVARYSKNLHDFEETEKDLSHLRDMPAETEDGYSICIRANIELPEEVEHVQRHGARGIGLFRTEFLYMNRITPPGEEDQFQIYKSALEAAGADNCVVFRTLDLGGDKFMSNINVGSELNPFMGQRAIRLCLQHKDIFLAQLRAILRASSFGRTRILIPMISGVEEFIEVKKHLQLAKMELKREGIAFDSRVEIGAMIEVPSAAIISDTLARHCVFFSIGTNDLIQYSLAVDRGNESVAYLYEPLHPAILRLLKLVIVAGHQQGISVSVCGEVAANPMMAIVLLGMGIDELSMSAVSVPSVKRLIRSIRLSEAKLLAEEVLAQTTIEGAKRVLRRRLRTYMKKRKVRGDHPRELSE